MLILSRRHQGAGPVAKVALCLVEGWEKVSEIERYGYIENQWKPLSCWDIKADSLPHKSQSLSQSMLTWDPLCNTVLFESLQRTGRFSCGWPRWGPRSKHRSLFISFLHEARTDSIEIYQNHSKSIRIPLSPISISNVTNSHCLRYWYPIWKWIC